MGINDWNLVPSQASAIASTDCKKDYETEGMHNLSHAEQGRHAFGMKRTGMQAFPSLRT